MIDRVTKLRWRRRIRSGKNQVEDLGSQAEQGFEEHLIKRMSRLGRVRRFIAIWVALIILLLGGLFIQIRRLQSYYLTTQPAPGGIYNEGILGSFTNVNPIYATGSVDSSVSRLVFAGLFTFNDKNQLVGELAKSYTVDARGTTYTVLLKDNLLWQDGKPLTAEDVVFTYNTIQNPDTKSPLASSWQGIKVAAIDKKTVTFTLPSILSAFPYSMVNGIIPKHVLGKVAPEQMRSVLFNTNNPIGSGPFKWDAIEIVGTADEDREQRIALKPNDNYVNGKPKLDSFVIRSFVNEVKMRNAFKKGELNGVVGLSKIPDDLLEDNSVRVYNIPLNSQVLLFLKTTTPVLSDQKVRQAISYGLNTGSVRLAADVPVLPSDSPLLANQLGYDKTLTQKTGSPEQAAKLLDEAGWKLNDKGIRVKDGKELNLTITTQSNRTYESVAKNIKEQLALIGVNVEILVLKDNELQSALAVHDYDSLLYGISLGPDPDVFAYWHSSQADLRSPSHLNFSEFKSPAADKALEAGRTRSDPATRAIKYRPFLDAWSKEAPAVALYQPRFLYVVREPLANFNPVRMNTGTDRYNEVNQWMIRETKQQIQ
ncbi:MAG: peptide ABC transporter substrate-binding protein [Candidatus Saccharibacteria bacterium]|nr:peptide ABC transporter substrate-binding protein [Candidatus Saccharibacteria bacterium]